MSQRCAYCNLYLIYMQGSKFTRNNANLLRNLTRNFLVFSQKLMYAFLREKENSYENELNGLLYNVL